MHALQVALHTLTARDGDAPSRLTTIELGVRSRPPALPVSFGIQQARDERMLMVLRGCADTSCSEVLAEQKLRVRFRAGQLPQISVLLTEPCLGAGQRCAGLASSCVPVTVDAEQAGTCVATREAAGVPIRTGRELWPVIDEPERDPDAAVAHSLDADLKCPVPNDCNEYYPCERDQGQGYICRGRFADWRSG